MMKYYCVKYYSKENNIKNTMKVFSISRIFLNWLSITAIMLLLVVLNNIIICDKRETTDSQVHHVYRRNLSELKNVDDSELGSRCENIQLKNRVEENNNDNVLSSESFNSEDDVKYIDVTSDEKCNNINYNDLSKQLTLEELHNILDNLKDHPSKENLRNIWTHTLGVAKEGVDNILKVLKESIQKHLDNDIYVDYDNFYGVCFLYHNIWKENLNRFYLKVVTEELEYTNKFFSLINGEHTLDDILKFIYSFLEYFKALKNELHEKHQKELLVDFAQSLYLWKHKYKF
ncbi:Plasmodium exported protein (PHISTa), unknown, putative [Plasmodium sp. gorilla clade G3]|nr:Plasmodium exported protein (PHISTa), unknown, putative [Plasmodium sp. gorilla clade G3]